MHSFHAFCFRLKAGHCLNHVSTWAHGPHGMGAFPLTEFGTANARTGSKVCRHSVWSCDEVLFTTDACEEEASNVRAVTSFSFLFSEPGPAARPICIDLCSSQVALKLMHHPRDKGFLAVQRFSKMQLSIRRAKPGAKSSSIGCHRW